jgi:hypothetical protein
MVSSTVGLNRGRGQPHASYAVWYRYGTVEEFVDLYLDTGKQLKSKGKKVQKTSVSNPNSLNLDPDPGFDDQKYKRFFFFLCAQILQLKKFIFLQKKEKKFS